MVLAHEQAAGPTQSQELWRLPNESFLLGLLAEVFREKAHKGAKAALLAALRENERAAVRCLQKCWRRRSEKVQVPVSRAAPQVQRTEALELIPAGTVSPALRQLRAVAAPEAAEPPGRPCPPSSTGVAAAVISSIEAAAAKLPGKRLPEPLSLEPAVSSCPRPAEAAASPLGEVPSQPALNRPAVARQPPSPRVVPKAAAGTTIQQAEAPAAAQPVVAGSRPRSASSTGERHSQGSEDAHPASRGGDNPYRRKWNPRLAAQHRKEREDRTGEQRTSSQPSKAAAKSTTAAPEADLEAPLQLTDAVDSPASHSEKERPEYRNAKLSLATPQGRGPEHAPGHAERLALTPREEEDAPGPAEPALPHRISMEQPRAGRGLRESRAPVTAEESDEVPRLARPPPRRTQEEEPADLDFSTLQRLISRGIACAEAGEEPSVEIDIAAGARPSGRRAASLTQRQLHAPRGASRGASLAEHTSIFEDLPPHIENKPALEDEDSGARAANLSCPPPAPARRPLTEPRSDVDRKTLPLGGLGSRGTSREREISSADTGSSTPRSSQALQSRSGGVYRPNHVYSGRSGNGLAATLGLKFGRPPSPRV